MAATSSAAPDVSDPPEEANRSAAKLSRGSGIAQARAALQIAAATGIEAEARLLGIDGSAAAERKPCGHPAPVVAVQTTAAAAEADSKPPSAPTLLGMIDSDRLLRSEYEGRRL